MKRITTTPITAIDITVIDGAMSDAHRSWRKWSLVCDIDELGVEFEVVVVELMICEDELITDEELLICEEAGVDVVGVRPIKTKSVRLYVPNTPHDTSTR